MEEVIRIFEQIKNMSGKNAKMEIIRQNKDNELFKKCLKFLLDPSVVTGISDKKLNKEVSFCNIKCIDNLNDIIDYLKTNNTGTDKDIATIKVFMSQNGNANYSEFYEQIITKKYRLGCDYKTVNKVIPNLIPTWEVQQAYPLSDKNKPKENEWFALTQKLNGNNAGFLDNKLISRQGKQFNVLQHIINDINSLPFDTDNLFFNGELIRDNVDGLSDDENFQLGTGIINSDDKDKSCIKFIIYEMLPKEEFLSGESKLKFKERRKELSKLDSAIKELKLKSITVVPILYEGTDQNKINELLNYADSVNWEGLMLNKNTKWKNKRNNGILKVKSFKSCDIRCTNILEGDGKYKGMLGLIECDYKGYTVGVGSGFTDEQRRFYWNNPDEILGKIVQVKFKTETKNKQGGLSIQFPIFQIVRDKSEPSYN